MIEKGQIYRAVKPVESEPTPRYRRIKVTGEPVTIPGVYGFGTVQIATLTQDGQEVRHRFIRMTELHISSMTASGEHRRNGYVLEGR